ncbi:MAG: ADP-heptose:LPS heptosyltransferase [Myxococcota bacterium]
MTRILARAPDHLGDGVLSLSAITALSPDAIVAPRWGTALYGHLSARILPTDAVLPAADVAVLFKPSWRAAWQLRHIPRRIGLSWDGRWPWLTDALPPGRRHRIDDYAALATLAGHPPPDPAPAWPTRSPAPPLPPDTVLLLPATASPLTVQWRGFRALADALGDRAVFTCGPGEEALIAAIAGPHRQLPPLSLPAFAAAAVAATAVVGNDSGLTHLAAAARRASAVPVTSVHVICASTDPYRTAAPGARWHMGPRPPCWPCYSKRCPFGAPCRDAELAPILTALQ